MSHFKSPAPPGAKETRLANKTTEIQTLGLIGGKVSGKITPGDETPTGFDRFGNTVARKCEEIYCCLEI
ncbi:hypothetical protein EYF80_030050 [Liparis tanakae]|uniref:Uncharacterized protein n=1 Tax=Liparis tanakae TaxID=230148 RepID=A0A4Z2H1N5_9TELE|nr:hypothetical protein EYF80_030050 [Liparis tanakae]